jgi:glycosyltransferase involved in cell wall biosynthesis
MRILFVHAPPDLYGASRSLLRLSSRLVSDGHEVMVILPDEGTLASELKASGVSVQLCPNLAIVSRKLLAGLGAPFQFLRNVVSSTVQLRRFVVDFKPDILHTNISLILTSGIVAKLVRRPHVWHMREVFADFGKLLPVLQWVIWALSDRIVCVSDAVKSQFHPRIQKKCVVIHNGFPKDEFADVPAERMERFKAQYSLNGNLQVGLVGRIRFGRKGQDVFLKAASMLKPRYPHVTYLCIGSPFPGNEEHLGRLNQLIVELGLEKDVVYTGDVEDIKAAYASLDVSVQPSVLPEAFGGVVIESMAMGKPVVASRSGGTLEQIEDGKTGFLITPGSSEELARALEALIEPETRARLGANGHAKYLQEFEFEPFYSRIIATYQSLLSRRSVA